MKKHIENIAITAGVIAFLFFVGCSGTIVEQIIKFFERVI